MHRYQPKFYIQPITSETSNSILENDLNNVDAWKNLCHRSSASAAFKFPETQFITVTAYQNQQVTFKPSVPSLQMKNLLNLSMKYIDYEIENR